MAWEQGAAFCPWGRRDARRYRKPSAFQGNRKGTRNGCRRSCLLYTSMGTAERSYPLRPQLGREKKEKEEKREAAAEGRTAGEQGRNPYAI